MNWVLLVLLLGAVGALVYFWQKNKAPFVANPEAEKIRQKEEDAQRCIDEMNAKLEKIKQSKEERKPDEVEDYWKNQNQRNER
jgi:hypothetical protein